MRVAAGPDLIYPYLLIRIELIRISNGFSLLFSCLNLYRYIFECWELAQRKVSIFLESSSAGFTISRRSSGSLGAAWRCSAARAPAIDWCPRCRGEWGGLLYWGKPRISLPSNEKEKGLVWLPRIPGGDWGKAIEGALCLVQRPYK